MAGKNTEMYVAGGVVALALAYYLMSDADAAPPVLKPPPSPGPLPPGPPSPSAFVPKFCPSMESELPDEYKVELDASLGMKLSSEFYGAQAQELMAAGYPKAASCFAAAQVEAAVREGLIAKVPGGNSVDQTQTCAFWMSQYNNEKAKLNAAIASSIPGPAFDPNWGTKLDAAQQGIATTKSKLASLGCPVP